MPRSDGQKGYMVVATKRKNSAKVTPVTIATIKEKHYHIMLSDIPIPELDQVFEENDKFYVYSLNKERAIATMEEFKTNQ